MTPTAYAPLVMWTLGIRDADRTSPTLAALSRAVTPELAARALALQPLRRRLEGVPVDRHIAAVLALGVLVRHRQLRHSPRAPLGAALHYLSDSTITALAVAAGATQQNACRLLGNALSQAAKAGPVNLVEFVALLTDWDTLDLRARSQFLVDLHSARRA